MFSSIKCVFAKHDYEQGAPFEPCDSPSGWPDVLAEQVAGWVGCRDRGSLSTVSNLVGKRKDRMQRKWRRIKPFHGGYVLRCYLCERQSVTILESVEEMRQSWDHLCYSGHTTPRAMLSPGVDPSTCLSCGCPLSHDMSARSDPVRGEDGEMATFAPWTFKLDLLFLSRGASLQCGGAAQNLPPPSSSGTCVERCWKAVKTSGWQWLLGELC